MLALNEQAQAGGANDTSMKTRRGSDFGRLSRAANPGDLDEHWTQIVRR